MGEIIKGPKWTGLRELLKSWQGWQDYRYVMLADDDLLMTEKHVSAFFQKCATQHANLAQPAPPPLPTALQSSLSTRIKMAAAAATATKA